jgi:subtilisin-like proprotein convertase family protein
MILTGICIIKRAIGHASRLVLDLIRAGMPTAVLAFAAVGVISSQSANSQSSGERLHYYDGNRKVEVVLALDELRLEADTATALSEASLKRSSPGLVSVTSVKGRAPEVDVALIAAANRADLDTIARGLVANSGAKAVNAILYDPNSTERTPGQKRILTRQLSLKLRADQDIARIAAIYNLRVAEVCSYSPRTYIVDALADSLLAALDTANGIHERENVEFATPLIARQQTRRLVPNDTLFGQQWHLRNTGATPSGAVAGNDVNATTAWDTYLGTGVNVAISDDGLQVAHPDLAANARTDIDIDINYGDNDPTPDVGGDDHGTCCAGVAAARGNNALGVSGAAPQAGLVGIRLISLPTTDAEEAQAMLHQINPASLADCVSINSNSWGPDDYSGVIEGPGPLTRAAFDYAAHNGRAGRGTIYTWAGGNGGTGDNANFDGYVNSRFTIGVGASGAQGDKSTYSEEGADLMCNAPSSNSSYGITTVDRTGANGYVSGDYYTAFGGTSSACPLAAGCIALILQANPSLTWRDVQHILVNTCTKNSPSDTGWLTNAAGKHFNHRFGFGRINATAATAAAAPWSLVPAEVVPLTASESVVVAIPDNNATGITRTQTISAPSYFNTEHVEVTVDITHPVRRHLEIYLTSPSGTVSKLAAKRSPDSDANISNWTFMTVANWGENPNGAWSLKVTDTVSGSTGTLNSWSLAIHGFLASAAEARGWEALY